MTSPRYSVRGGAFALLKAAFLAAVTLLTSCTQSTLTTSPAPTLSDPFFAHASWTANGTVANCGYIITYTSTGQTLVVTSSFPLPTSTWTFSVGNNLQVSSTPSASYFYAPNPDGTVLLTAISGDSVPVSGSYPSPPVGWTNPAGTFASTFAYAGTYVCTVLTSSHVQLSHAGIDIDLTFP